MKTRESQDHGEQDAVWFKIAFPTTRKLREGLVAIADETGVARSATYHLALRRGLASLALFFPQNVLTSRSSATRASEPNNSHKVVTRSCRGIVAGFLLPSIHRRRESGPQQCPGLSLCSL